MKKVIGIIIGFLFTSIGLICLIIANMQINMETRYTFKPPLTEYEAGVLITKYIGIGMLVIGIIILLLLIISSIYYSKNVRDVKNGYENYITCPVCHCKTTADSEYCPRCFYKYK